ncbi:MAG: hypothetical protein H6766_02035 [Candidatus Peribacteria bacterium]|nr:MAG: hypothetical protein H6766_02035 [Candidatus Peribacteria bacterium]
MAFNRATLTPEQKHDHLLQIYEQIRGHCDNFEIIYQYLLAGQCSPVLIEGIYQTTETLSQQGHENILNTKDQKLQTILHHIHQQEQREHENADTILFALETN